MIFLWVLSVQLVWQCQPLVCQAQTTTTVTTTTQSLQRKLRVSQSDLDNPVPLDYKIPKFSILLEPTPHRITDDMVAAILSPILEEVLFDSLGGVQTQSNRLLLAQAYVEEEIDNDDNDGDNNGDNDNGERRRTRRVLVTTNNDTASIPLSNNTIANSTDTNSTDTITDSNNNDNAGTINNNDTETTNNDNDTNVIQSTLIIVKGGLVSFKRTPPLEKIPEVIEDGINYKLVNKLPKDSTVFGSITKATFVPIESSSWQTPPPPPSTSLNPSQDGANGNGNNNNPPGDDEMVTRTLPPTVPTASGVPKSSSSSSSSISSWFDDLPLINVIAAPIVILLGIGLILWARKKRSQNLVQHQQLKDNSFETQDTNNSHAEEDDAKSISEWTTATTETQNHQYLAKSQYLASEETFERNSKLAVKKDMLESEWCDATYNPKARVSASSETNSETSKRSLV